MCEFIWRFQKKITHSRVPPITLQKFSFINTYFFFKIHFYSKTEEEK